MDSSNQTSFIPKKPISQSGYAYEQRGVSVATVICIIVFFGSVALSLGSYLYKNFLQKSLADKKETLERARKGFDLDTIKDLKRLDTRIEVARKLLDRHTAVSGLFGVLEQATLKSVRLNDMNLTIGDTSSSPPSAVSSSAGGNVQIKARASAKNYTSVALQSDVFNKTKGLKEPIFADLSLDDKGNVNFSISAFVDPQILKFRTVIGESQINEAQSPVSNNPAIGNSETNQ